VEWRTDVVEYFKQLRQLVPTSTLCGETSELVIGPGYEGYQEDGDVTDDSLSNYDLVQMTSNVSPSAYESGLDSATSCRLINHLVSEIGKNNSTNERQSEWIFAALVSLDDLQAMEAEVASNLQMLRRHFERFRKRLETPCTGDGAMGVGLASLNLIITIIRDYFHQV